MSQTYWSWVVLIFLCVPCLGWAEEKSHSQQPAPVSPAEETALRSLAEQFFAAYAKKDLDGFMALWSSQSPEWSTRKQQTQQLFAENEKIEVKSVTISKVKLEGEKASLHVEVDMRGVEAKTGKASPALGKKISKLDCVKEKGMWKVWREVDAVEELAAALAALKTDPERTVLLEEKQELVTEELGQALVRLGDGLRLQGNYSQALSIYGLAQATAKQLGDQAGIAGALRSIGLVHYYQGNYNQALDYFQKSLVFFESLGDRAGIARALNGIGLVYWRQGNYAESLDYFQKSLVLREALGDKAGIAGPLNNMGLVHYHKGNYTQALDYFQKGLASFEAAGDKEGIVHALGNIGNVYGEQGDYAQALEYYQRGLTLEEHMGYKDGIVTSLLNIGVIYQRKGDYARALEYFQKGLRLAEALDDKDEIATSLLNIGEIYQRKDDYVKALEYYQRGLRLAETLGDKEAIGYTLNNIGEVYRLQDNPAQALEFVERAAAIARQIGHREILWQSSTISGRAHRALHRFDHAHEALAEAIEIIESLRVEIAGGEQEQQRFFENKLAPYHQMIELLIAQNKISEALTYAERSKARVLLDVLHSGRVNIAKAMTAFEQEQEQRFRGQSVSLSSQLYRENLSPQPDPSRLGDLKALLEKARLEYSAFQTALYVAHPELKVQRGEVPPITLEQAAGLVPDEKNALLEFVLTEEKIYLFVLTKEKQQDAESQERGDTGIITPSPLLLRVYPVELKRKDLNDWVQRFRQQLARRDPTFRASANQLYELLVRPANGQLQGKTSLVIVPDGVLWEVPFQALLSEGHYLLEDHAVAYAPSLTALREMIRLRSKETDRPASFAKLLAFGNPTLGKETVERVKQVLMDERLEPLPEAEKQVKLLGQLYGTSQSKVYVGADAREARFKAEAGSYGMLQLATHGILNDASPMYSHLLLSQGRNQKEDGLLEAWELLQMELNAELVVLSACETARGRVGAGEGMIGLSWALFVAGTPTTVVSQWKVESASTTQLMVAFHRNLKTRNPKLATQNSKAQALRQAALKLLRSSQYAHPFYWAGFVIVGDGS